MIIQDTASSVSAMIASLNGPTLLQRRNYLKLIMMYKITRGLAETPFMDLIPLSTITRAHSRRYQIPSTRVNSYLYSFLPTTIKLWNKLPQEIVDAPSLDHFKKLLVNLPYTTLS